MNLKGLCRFLSCNRITSMSDRGKTDGRWSMSGCIKKGECFGAGRIEI